MSFAERDLWAVELGLCPYDQTWSLQGKLMRMRQEAAIPDLLLLVEHEPVITVGKGGQAQHILISEEELNRRGIAIHRVDRGGDVTFHGPGQIVAYPILNLTHHGKDVHLYCRKLEEVGLRVLSDYGLCGQRVPGLTGVWVGQEKVMAIGVGVRKWITCHGLALNVNTDLDYFRFIHPCGIQDRGVTSLACLLQREVAPAEVKERLVFHFSCIFEAKIQRVTEGDLREAMGRGSGESSEAILAGATGTQV